MFSLFGKSKSQKDESLIASTNDPMATLQKLDEQVECIEKKEKVLQIKIKDLVKEALENKQANNQKKAIFALRKKKLYQQELDKLDGMKTMLEEQKITLESRLFDNVIFEELEKTNKILTHREEVNIED